MGAGVYAKAVYDAAVLNGIQIDGLAVSDTRCAGFNHIKVISEEEIVTDDRVILAISDNRIRTLLFNELKMIKAKVLPLVHPAAWISDNASIGEGSIILAGAMINHSAVCGKACIIGTRAVIESDCILEYGVNVGAGAVLTTGVTVGSETTIGAGAVIASNVRIGKGCVVKPGEVVLSNLADGTGA